MLRTLHQVETWNNARRDYWYSLDNVVLAAFGSWADSLDIENLYLSVITIVELESGILRMEQKDGAQGALLRSWFENAVLHGFDRRILPVTLEVAHVAAALHVPNPSSNMDALIGATALVNHCTLATRNTKDFERFGISLVNPWMHPT